MNGGREMNTNNIILCYIYDGMADFEITLILHRLNNTGNRRIVSISEQTDVIQGQSGLRFMPMKKISEITDLSNVEALIIPGGPINNEQNAICEMIQRLVEEGKLVAAICFAPQFLGRAGILENYRFTTSCTRKKVAELGLEDPFNWSNYVEERAVRDRNVITAKGYALVDFALLIVEYLDIYSSDEQKYEQIERVYLK